jgi:hypothetical protein
MNALIAMTIRACALGIKNDTQQDKYPALYIELLEKLATEVESPMRVASSAQPSELEMHRADYEAVKAAGFTCPGELLSAYSTLSASMAGLRMGCATISQERDTAREELHALKEKFKPWTDAQTLRAWRNSPALHKDCPNAAAWARLALAIEQMHGIVE